MKHLSIPCTIALILVSLSSISYAQTDVLTQHNDLARTGWNSQETLLDHSNVSSTTFGELFTLTTDDQIYAQPLVVSQVNIPSWGTKNVLYVCTVNNTVYAIDADNGTTYWQKNFTPSGFRVPGAGDIHASLCNGTYDDFVNKYGIVSTPVIDKSAKTIYFVTKIVDTTSALVDNHTYNSSIPNEQYTYSSTGFHQYLHAIDLSTGVEKLNGGNPVEITGSYPGTGDGAVAGVISFDPRRSFSRAGLVLSQGIVYVSYSSHCDWDAVHGWVMGYDASTLQQKMVYNTTPNDGRGNIWMNGGAPAVDASGSLYFTTGNANAGGSIPNGTPFFTALPSDPANRGESVVKLTPNAPNNTATALNVSSYFTPFDYVSKNINDLDFLTLVLLIPNTNHLIAGCKDQNLYLMDRTNLGGYNMSTNNVLQTVAVAPPNSGARMHSSLAYFGGSDAQYIYQLSEASNLMAYPINGSGLLGTPTVVIDTPIAKWPKYHAGSGGFMSVSSDGADTSTGILWLSSANGKDSCNGAGNTCPGVLRAIKANDIKTELWNSDQFAGDYAGFFQKMNCPTIANGKVYLASASKQLIAYGSLATPRCAVNIALSGQVFASSPADTIANKSVKPSLAFDGNSNTAWGSDKTDNQYVYVDLGRVYNICTVTISWGAAFGENFTVDVSSDATHWTTQETITGNSALFNQFTMNVQGRYVRMNGTKRGISFLGYSVNEMQVWGAAAIPLPVNLISFTANNVNNEYVQLHWSTSGEVSSAYFDVERSGNGSSFEPITRLDAAGNSSQTNEYSTRDIKPLDGINFYRLKQVDLDGNAHYSQVVKVNFGGKGAPAILPNPASSFFNVIAGALQIKAVVVYDPSGKTLAYVLNGSASSNVTVPTGNWAAGVYIVEIRTATQVYRQKLVKQ